MSNFQKLFGTKVCNVIGMIHVDALPGTPKYAASFTKTVDKAKKQAEIYARNQLDGVLIENMHDLPYVKSESVGFETVACLTRIATEIKKVIPTELPCGVQILAGANKQALAVAKASGLDFIRSEGYVFGHIGDEGYIDSDAGSLLRYRKQIDAENVLVFTDVKKKHSSHAVTSDISVDDVAKAAEFFLSDGVILTGASTGCAADKTELVRLKSLLNIPVLVGSGVTKENLKHFKTADAVIIGSHFKKGGKWENDINIKAVSEFMSNVKIMRDC